MLFLCLEQMLQKVGLREINELNRNKYLAKLTSQGSIYILTVNSNHDLNSYLCLSMELMPVGSAFLNQDPSSVNIFMSEQQELTVTTTVYMSA